MTLYSRKAYTLVEIMIVIAIIAIISSIVFRNYLKDKEFAARNICINNLKQIDGAVEQWAFDNGIRAGTVPTSEQEEAIYNYIGGGKPKCPGGGEYTIQVVGSKPQVKCSLEDAGHKLPE